jgi:hypothetical protein
MIKWRATLFQGRATGQNVRGVLPATFIMDRFDIAQGRLIGELDLELQAGSSCSARRLPTVVPRGIDPLGRVCDQRPAFHGDWGVEEYQLAGSTSGGNRFSSRTPVLSPHRRRRCSDRRERRRLERAAGRHRRHAAGAGEITISRTHRGIQDIAWTQDLLRRFEETKSSYMYSLGGVAVIGLIVGGIGIMNVMLASISERVREIGVRRALGAKRVDVLVQILAESLTLALAGGLVGIVASVGLIAVLQRVVVEANRPGISPGALFIGIVSSGWSASSPGSIRRFALATQPGGGVADGLVENRRPETGNRIARTGALH